MSVVAATVEDLPLVPEVSPEENESLWRAGVLFHLLDSLQRELYEWWWSLSEREKQCVALVSRRAGKTFTFVVICCELALRRKVKLHYAAETAKQVREFLLPTFDIILESCPEDLRPVYKRGEGKFYFPSTGSTITLVGCEDKQKADRLRGPYSDGAFIDEAGYNHVLRYVVVSIFRPMLKGRKGARITMYSNAPFSPSHDIVPLMNAAKDRGAFYHATIYDSPRFTDEEIAEEAEAYGGFDSTDFIREYMALVVVDEDTAIMPEWSSREELPWVMTDTFRARPPEPGDDPEEINPPLVREIPRPAYYDTYTFLDPGFNDLLSLTACYWDYVEQLLVVVAERELYKATTDLIAMAVKEIEQEAWGDYWDWIAQNHGWPTKPYLRVMDRDKRLRADLESDYDLTFTLAVNQDLKKQVADLRRLTRRGGLVVHPRCTGTVAHLRAGYWDTTGNKFARPNKKPPADGSRYYGHFDHISSLQLGYGRVNTSHDPFPKLPPGVSPLTHMVRKFPDKPDDGITHLARRMRRRR